MDKYQKHTHREHIYSLPDTYIGSIETAPEEHYVVSEKSFVQKTVPFNPGFYKLVDELLVNAHDHVVRLQQRKSTNPVKNIWVSVDSESLTIKNDGEAIDVEQHPQHGWIPQMIFGELLTSTNYDKTEKKLVGGKNGYGVKLVNIFAKSLEVTVVDSVREVKYVQLFENNMTKIGKPVITKSKLKSFVQLVWTPDFQKFGMSSIPEGMLQVIQRRVHDLALTAGRDVKVMWNTEHLKFKDLTAYASWYIPETKLIVDTPQERWNIAVSDSPTDKLMTISFVNGIWTRSGKHVDEIVGQIVSYIVGHIETKKKVKVKPAMVRELLAVFIHCSVENPSFSSQTKEVLTSKVSCKLSPEFLKKLLKLELVEKVLEEQDKKDQKEQKKTDGRKVSKIVIPKLDDASLAGTAKSHECTLILTEGDSAKSMAVSGLTQAQRASFGVFPLRGKLLNVKDTSARKVEQTEEVANLKKILGLESGKKYSDVKSLRYGRILIMTDQDYDGSHIRGLLINLFHELWHDLIKIPGFITYMATPIVKATKASKVLSFFTQYEYEEWKKLNSGWNVKYYKGLGTSTPAEAREYFKSMNVVKYTYADKKDDESIELAFNKSMADKRKTWLSGHLESNILTSATEVRYSDFVDKDLIHFSNYNLERSIPNMMDGLKTSQRKILFSAFKRKLHSEIRVAQFAGYVSEHSGYHHGEASLNDTIVGMAQDFVGSNNLPWFVPQGQFGTRLQGGKDSASPRYIHTYLHKHVANLIPREDLGCLEYREDDGLPVEPYWYAPVIPMLLVNGARGIGTGYSTFIPPCDPEVLVSGLKAWLQKKASLDDICLEPWYAGFKGTVKDLTVSGCWTIKGDIMEITELPVETWTSDYKEWLDTQEELGIISGYTNTSTDTQVNFKIKLTGNTEHRRIIEKSLSYKLKLTNMHAFNSKCQIQKYDSYIEILKEFSVVRLDLYVKRKAYQLAQMNAKLPYHENVVRFITQQCFDMPIPDLKRKTLAECDVLLDTQKFLKIDGSYDYLLDLPFKSLTAQNAQKHRDSLESLRESIKTLESKTPEDLWLSDLELFAKNK
jgi:DNA topoisomerase-2